MKCRECGERIHRGEPYRLVHVPGGHKPGSTYHHEYAHRHHDDPPIEKAPTQAATHPTQHLQWTDAVSERMRLCLEVCSGVRSEDLREIAANGGLKSFL